MLELNNIGKKMNEISSLGMKNSHSYIHNLFNNLDAVYEKLTLRVPVPCTMPPSVFKLKGNLN